MSELIRKIMQGLFGRRYVYLIILDGELRLSRVWWEGGRMSAAPYTFRDIGTCYLLDDGKVIGPTYVKGWVPYDAFAPRVTPKFDWNENVPDNS